MYINTYWVLQITSGIFMSPFGSRKWAFLEVTTGLMSPGLESRDAESRDYVDLWHDSSTSSNYPYITTTATTRRPQQQQQQQPQQPRPQQPRPQQPHRPPPHQQQRRGGEIGPKRRRSRRLGDRYVFFVFSYY